MKLLLLSYVIQDNINYTEVDMSPEASSETKSDASENFSTDIIENVMESIVEDLPGVTENLEVSTAEDEGQVYTFRTEIDESNAAVITIL